MLYIQTSSWVLLIIHFISNHDILDSPYKREFVTLNKSFGSNFCPNILIPQATALIFLLLLSSVHTGFLVVVVVVPGYRCKRTISNLKANYSFFLCLVWHNQDHLSSQFCHQKASRITLSRLYINNVDSDLLRLVWKWLFCIKENF